MNPNYKMNPEPFKIKKHIMSWLQQQVSLYSTYADNAGRPASYRDILLSDFGKDLSTILKLRKMDKGHSDYKKKKLALKGSLQCFTPAALLETKAKDQVKVISRTGIMQLDFDFADIHQYDIEELKQAVFSLPFIGFCGLSCSGDGFYVLGVIAEPEKLSDYAEHCFEILLNYGIKADTSKGKKVENLRFVSYDSNMLIRENPTPLFVKQFKKKKIEKISTNNSTSKLTAEDLANERLIKGIKLIREVMQGSRWETVQKVAYTIGGLGNKGYLTTIEEAINNNSAFAGQEDKYCKCAEVCFEKGFNNPYNDFK
jgi:hypothetical protein